jgi:tetratricopeptide (TPR) repeat protein
MMRMKAIYLSAILLVLVPICRLGNIALADEKAELRQAEAYDKNGQDKEAEAAYTKIVTDYAGTDWAVKAQRGLATMYIIRGEYTKAEEAVKKLTVELGKSPGAAEAIYRVGDMYRMMEKHSEAKSLYQYVAKQYPQDAYAIWGQMYVVICDFYLGNEENAQLEIDELKKAFAEDSSLPTVLCVIGQQCRQLQIYEQARNLFRYVQDTWPENEYATWAQRDMIILEIEAGNDSAAQAALDKMLSEFSDAWGLPRAVYDVAVAFRWKAGNRQKANELFGYIVDKWTKTENPTWVQVQCVAMANIALGNDTAAQVAIDRLIESFRDEPPVPRAVYEIAAECYYPQGENYQSQGDVNEAQDSFQNAIAVLNRIIVDLPQGTYTPWAYDLTADCHQKLNEYDKSIKCLKKIVKDYPDYDYAWDAQFMIDNRVKELTTINRNPR